MKLRGLLAVLVGFGWLSAQAPAQIGYSEKTNEILGKINWLDMSKWLLPILADKKQLNDLLVGIERAQGKVEEIRKLDERELVAMDKEITEALDAAVLKQTMPSKALQAKIAKLTSALAIRQQIATNENVDMMMEVVKKTLNAGQIKAISNLVDPKLFDPSAKADKMTEDQRVRMYVRYILLDRTAYEFLRLLYKQAK